MLLKFISLQKLKLFDYIYGKNYDTLNHMLFNHILCLVTKFHFMSKKKLKNI